MSPQTAKVGKFFVFVFVFVFVFLTFFISLMLYLFCLFIYFWLHWVFVAVRGLFSSCGEWRLLFVAVQGLLIEVASLVVEHGL